MAKDPAQRPATALDFLDALEEALDGEVAPAGPPTAVTAPVPATPRPPTRPVSVAPVAARRRWPGLAALAALALVAGAAIAIAAGSGGDGNGSTSTPNRANQPAASRPKPKPKPKPKAQTTQAQTQTQTTTEAPAQPATPAPQAKSDDPVALNDQGFALIGQGQPTDAVAPLQRSVEAFRAQGRKGDIGYAYALYNLGNALRLSGRPAEAIPFLEERLQISNYKRGIVKKELETARQQAG
jgi:eukaryotic-like serine/threonine-protein kinase